MAKYNSRFQAVAEQIHCLTITRSANENSVTLMELRNILRLLGFGHSVTNLTVSIKAFNLCAQRHICDRLFQYIGPQLRSLTLSSFGVTTEQFELMKPLLFHLNFLDIDFNYNFDYRRFNCAWPNLKTLRMRTPGFVDTFISEDEPAPEFPALTKLMIASGYRLHKNLFQRLHRACSKITELVVINIDDYYSELPTLVLRTTDLANLSEFTELTRLHLSFSRSYFNATIIDVISKLTKLEHLTLEITNVRQSDDRIFMPLNRSLRQIGSCLPNIAEVRFSGIPLEEDKLVELIRFATKLQSLCIYECNIELNAQLIRNIVTSRKELFSTTIGQRTPIPLNIIVNEFSDPVLMNVSIPTTTTSNFIVRKFFIFPSFECINYFSWSWAPAWYHIWLFNAITTRISSTKDTSCKMKEHRGHLFAFVGFALATIQENAIRFVWEIACSYFGHKTIFSYRISLENNRNGIISPIFYNIQKIKN